MVEGTDYRGISVLASLGDIPGTPWVLACKIDQLEIYAGQRRLLWTIALNRAGGVRRPTSS